MLSHGGFWGVRRQIGLSLFLLLAGDAAASVSPSRPASRPAPDPWILSEGDGRAGAAP
jgi:hypothetical protein